MNRGGKAPNLNPNSPGLKSKFSAPYLFGDISPTSNLLNDQFNFSSTSLASTSNASTSLSQLNGFDGGDGGNITIVTSQRLKHVLFNIEVNCNGGEGGEAGSTQFTFESKRSLPMRDSFQFPAEVPLSTSVTSNEVLTFSHLSFYNPNKVASKIRDSRDESFIEQGTGGVNSVVRGLDGRKGRDGSVKFVIISDQDKEVIVEQSVSMFALELTNFRIQRRIPKRSNSQSSNEHKDPSALGNVQEQKVRPPTPFSNDQQRRQKVFGNLIIEDDDDDECMESKQTPQLPGEPGKTTNGKSNESNINTPSAGTSLEEVFETPTESNNVEYDLIDLDEFAEPGSELVISEIEVKNLGGLSTPENCLFTFKGNALFDPLGFDKISLTPFLRSSVKPRNSTSTMSDGNERSQTSFSNEYVKIPSLKCGETFSILTPFIARIRRIDKSSVDLPSEPKITSLHQECVISSEFSHIPSQTLSWQSSNSLENAYSLQRVIANIPIQYPIAVSEISTPKTLLIGELSSRSNSHHHGGDNEHTGGAIIEVKLRNTSSTSIHNQVQIRIQIRMDEEAGETATKERSLPSPPQREEPSSSDQQPESSASTIVTSHSSEKSYFFLIDKVSTLSLPPTIQDISKKATSGGQPNRSALLSSSSSRNNAPNHLRSGKNDRSLLFNDQLSMIESVVVTSSTHLEEESQMVSSKSRIRQQDDLYSIYQQQKEKNEVFFETLEALPPYSESSWVFQLKLYDLHKILMKRNKQRSQNQQQAPQSSSYGQSSYFSLPPLDELLGFCQGSIIISIYYKDCLLERRVSNFKCIPKTVQQVMAKGSFLLNTNSSTTLLGRSHSSRYPHHQEFASSSSSSKALHERYAILLTSSENLQNKSYVFYKRLVRELGLELIVWDLDSKWPGGEVSRTDSVQHSLSDSHHQILTLFKDNLILITLFKAPQHDSKNAQFNALIGQLLQKQQEFERDLLEESRGLFFEGGILFVSSCTTLDKVNTLSSLQQPFTSSTPSEYLRNQILNKCRPPLQMIEPKSLSIFYPFEKPSKQLFQEKVDKYLRKKQEENPSNVIQIHRKEYFDISKSRMPRKILLGSCQYSILPVKVYNRIFRYVFSSGCSSQMFY